MFWRDARFIAGHDLSYLFKQRETLLWMFLMPPLFFYFIGTVTAGAGPVPGLGAEERPLALVAPGDSGFLLDELVVRLEAEGYRVDRPGSDEELARYSRQLIVPSGPGAGLTDAVMAGQQTELVLKRTGDALAARYDLVSVSRAVYGVVADVAVVRQQGGLPEPEAFSTLAAMPRALTLDVEAAGAREDPPSGFAQSVPGLTVMFTMLIMLTSGSIMLVVEREQGLLRRLASTPISRGSVVAGKWLGRTALGAVQIGYGMLLGQLLFGMEWGRGIGVLLLVLVAWAGFNASLAILLANFARSEGQMAGIGVMATMVLAALGGCWWPIEVTPAWMQKLALTLPSGWAMDAMHKLVSFGYGPLAAAPHLVALALATLVLGAAASRTFRYQ